jgi:hypothetical protein
MLRVNDAARTLAARGWAAEGTVVLAIDGVALELAVQAGRAVVTPSRADPDARLDAPALAAVALGGLRASHAARLGWLAARDDYALARVDALLALPPFFSPDPF